MAEQKKPRLSAVERAKLQLAEAEAKAAEKEKAKRQAALTELARRRRALNATAAKVEEATAAATAAGVPVEEIENLNVDAVLAAAKPKQTRKPASKKDETKES